MSRTMSFLIGAFIAASFTAATLAYQKENPS
jgi:hypothetical protein